MEDPSSQLNDLRILLLEQHATFLTKMYEDLHKIRQSHTGEERELLISGVLSNLKTEIQSVRGELRQIKPTGNAGTTAQTLSTTMQLPDPCLEQTVALAEIKSRLLKIPASNEDRPPVVLLGADGSGKSVAAALLANDAQIQQQFGDGIYWLISSPEPDLIKAQIELIQYLGGTPGHLLNIESGAEKLQELFQKKSCLIIFDNVWDMQDVQAIAVAGRYSQMLITTENEHLFDFMSFFHAGAKQYTLSAFNEKTSARYIAQCAGLDGDDTSIPFEVDELARRCGGLPLALRLTGSIAKLQGTRDWNLILERMAEDDGVVSDSHPPLLLQGLHIVLEYLGDDAEYYLAMGVFRESWRIPAKPVIMLWNYLFQLSEKASIELLHKFQRLGLLDLLGEPPLGLMSLHGFQAAYLHEYSDIDKLHGHLLSAYLRQCGQGWLNGPHDGYFFDHLCKHLAGARRNKELKSLLLNFEWLQKKLAFSTVHSILEDYALLDDPDVILVNKALETITTHPLRDEEQLAASLLDIVWEKATKDLNGMINQAKELVPGWVPPFPEDKKI